MMRIFKQSNSDKYKLSYSDSYNSHTRTCSEYPQTLGSSPRVTEKRVCPRVTEKRVCPRVMREEESLSMTIIKSHRSERKREVKRSSNQFSLHSYQARVQHRQSVCHYRIVLLSVIQKRVVKAVSCVALLILLNFIVFPAIQNINILAPEPDKQVMVKVVTENMFLVNALRDMNWLMEIVQFLALIHSPLYQPDVLLQMILALKTVQLIIHLLVHLAKPDIP